MAKTVMYQGDFYDIQWHYGNGWLLIGHQDWDDDKHKLVNQEEIQLLI
ncbi:hypothetical protein [Tuberibacillus sp. Marseille-P3662]|nr:hypothetical protein [Tuberibacillus sp. Marseille-P3662]